MSPEDVDEKNLFPERWQYASLFHHHADKWISHKLKKWNRKSKSHKNPSLWIEIQKRKQERKWDNFKNKLPANAQYLINWELSRRGIKEDEKEKEKHERQFHLYEKLLIDLVVFLPVNQLTKSNALDVSFFDYATFIGGDYLARTSKEWPVLNSIQIPFDIWYANIFQRAFLTELIRLLTAYLMVNPKISPIQIIHDFSKLVLSFGISNIFTN